MKRFRTHKQRGAQYTLLVRELRRQSVCELCRAPVSLDSVGEEGVRTHTILRKLAFFTGHTAKQPALASAPHIHSVLRSV